jgi:hypothetical protein
MSSCAVIILTPDVVLYAFAAFAALILLQLFVHARR